MKTGQDMEKPASINSEEYWSSRFDSDWQDKGGPDQTLFFYRLALDLLPAWLTRQMQAEKLSICDWGCATGEGTSMLAQTFSGSVTGIDFAERAIIKAKQRFSLPRFLSIDLMSSSWDEVVDVLFCSNTLEHFQDPWGTLTKISAYARQTLVVLVPFREYHRHQEHEVTFDVHMVPANIADKFHLVSAQVVNAATMPDSYWPGEQILLVYSTSETIKRCVLKLADLSAIHALTSTTSPEIIRLQTKLETAEEKLKVAMADALESKAEIVRLRDAVAEAQANGVESKAEIVRLRDAVAEAQAKGVEIKGEYANQLNEVYNSTSWRITGPMRKGILHLRKQKGSLRSKVRVIYKSLPHSVQRWLRNKVSAANPALSAARYTPLVQGAALPPLSDKPDVFIWAVIDWHFRVQRPQHLARAFAHRGHRTFYFSGHFIDSGEPGFKVESLSDDGSLQVIYLQVRGAPSIYFGMPDDRTQDAIFASLSLFLQWANSREILSIVQHPFWRSFADRMNNRTLIYDLMDHHEGFGDNASDVITAEHALLRDADHVIVTSTFLEEVARKSNDRVSMVRNAGEYKHFSVAPAEVYRDAQGRKVIGYYGAIAEWFDLDLMERVAQAYPDACVLLIGGDTVKAKERLARHPNVVLTGEVPYDKLPYYLYGFDLCILPFKVIPLTLATNPVKVYEYLSAGKPVVSIDLPEIQQFGDCVTSAATHHEFVAAVGRELSAPVNAELEAKRRAFAAEQTWDHRVDAFCEALETSRRPMVSIIVVTYNNLDFTKECLNSLELHTAYDNYEIIVVDNASSDGSREFLNGWANGAGNRTIILNDDNRGFAAANNQGLECALGDYFVLLNNDTYVTPGWLGTLLQHLKKNDKLALVGPVTNNIGNEAKIPIAYSNMDEMQKAALQYTSQHLGRLQRVDAVAFFCVAFSRDTLNAVGVLDEAFGVGFFEDDDYCMRARVLGRQIGIADDVFIHHHLSASFDTLKANRKRQLFEENRAIYEAKWGAWKPHSYRNA